MRRRATVELFDWLGLTHVPGEFWPILETERDPIDALELFTGQIGCSFVKVRRRDPVEIERFQNVIDMLALGAPFISKLNAAQKERFQHELRRRRYDKCFKAAKRVADLQGLLSAAETYLKEPTLFIFRSFMDVVRSLAAAPFEATEADVADAMKHASGLYRRVEDLRRFKSGYDNVIDSFADWFHDGWRGTERETEITNLIGHATACIKDLMEVDLDFDAVDERLERLKYCVENLLKHRAEGERATAGGWRDSGFPHESEIHRALRFFSFGEDSTPDCGALKKAFRELAKRWHPDRFSSEGFSDAHRREAEERLRQTIEWHNLLKTHLGCA